MVSRKAQKDHPWRQGYQGIRPNHSHPVIIAAGWNAHSKRYNNKRGHSDRASTDEQEEQLNLAQAIRDMLG